MPDAPLQIDLQSIIDKRVPPAKRRLIPRALVRWLEKLVRQDALNGILRRTFPHRGGAFASAALKDLGITIIVKGRENIPGQGRFIFASNHPLGGLDGIALITVLTDIFGEGNLRFPVNDLLMNVEPLCDVFTPINKFGRQGRRAALDLQEIYASPVQMAYFPAGLVSRLHKGGDVRDLTWHKAFVAKAMEHDRTIVPVFFSGVNSGRFYRLARWRKRLGIKFNFEQILLPSELIKASGSTFTITFGTPIAPAQLRASGKSPALLAEEIKQTVYKLR